MAKWPEGAILFAAQTTPLWIFHAYDKEQRVERLKKRYVKGTLTKADINKQGYNKFLLEIRYTLMKQRLKRIGLGMVLRAQTQYWTSP